MCHEIVKFCPHCYARKKSIVFECSEYWTQLGFHVWMPDKIPKPAPYECPDFENETCPCRLGACPNIENCDSRELLLRKRKEEEEAREAEEEDEEPGKKLAAQEQFEKVPVQPRPQPVAFMDLGKRDVQERRDREMLEKKEDDVRREPLQLTFAVRKRTVRFKGQTQPVKAEPQAQQKEAPDGIPTTKTAALPNPKTRAQRKKALKREQLDLVTRPSQWFTLTGECPPRRQYVNWLKPGEQQSAASVALDKWLQRDDDAAWGGLDEVSPEEGLSCNSRDETLAEGPSGGSASGKGKEPMRCEDTQLQTAQVAEHAPRGKTEQWQPVSSVIQTQNKGASPDRGESNTIQDDMANALREMKIWR